MYHKLKPIFFLLLFIVSHDLFAERTTLSQTKIKLQQIESKITQLQKTLDSAHNKTEVLHQELAQTDKRISEGVQQLHKIQRDMSEKQKKIGQLQKQAQDLNKELQAQQHLLANHIKARFTMGENQPLKWLLNQDDPYKTSRILTFYQYVIESRQRLIEEIQLTQKKISQTEENLKQALAIQTELQQQLSRNQQKLEEDKHYNTTIILSLDQEIKKNKTSLEDYQQNKGNLSVLLKTLTQQSISKIQRPFASMRQKLPKPIAARVYHIQSINQGVVFFAEEGTPVSSVYPGKVVFSDWLKGYGLLIIIDHGQGFMTLYAHNQSLFKQKGDIVQQGTQIATVGHSGGIKQNGLYFEIRQRGKAISPQRWLA